MNRDISKVIKLISLHIGDKHVIEQMRYIAEDAKYCAPEVMHVQWDRLYVVLNDNGLLENNKTVRDIFTGTKNK